MSSIGATGGRKLGLRFSSKSRERKVNLRYPSLGETGAILDGAASSWRMQTKHARSLLTMGKPDGRWKFSWNRASQALEGR